MNNCKYFKAKLQSFSTLLEMESLDEMANFIEANSVTNIFIVSKENDLNTSFFMVPYQHMMMWHNTLGFQTIKHYQQAIEKGFPNAQTFYEAQAKGYTKYSDYVLVQEAGIADLATFENLKKKGYITGFDKYKQLISSNEELRILNLPINNPFELYTYATKNHFEDCAEFLQAFEQGFTNAEVYGVASKFGFLNYWDYKEATDKKISSYEDLLLIRNLKIRDADEFYVYLDLSKLKNEEETFDQLVLLGILSKIEQGKKVSINKLTQALNQAIDEYKYPQDNQLPAWFTVGIHSQEALIDFLVKNNTVKNYGSYDVDGEYFEVHKIQDRAVVLDASNIAHNSNNTHEKRVLAENIIRMIEFLKEKGFEDITTIADASLKHKIHDKDVFEQLKNDYDYLESPSDTSADAFIIEYVKRKHCLLVSNDTFRQWKANDRWVAENIDFYRLAFILNKDEVLMPDVK